MDPSGQSSSTSQQPTEETLVDLKKAIWARRPILGDIMEKHGKKNLFDYSKDFLDVNPSPLLDARKEELISMTEELLIPRIGAKDARGVAEELRKLPLVSTTDHHGPIQHPFFLNANIISALPYSEFTAHPLDYLVVFSFASVSLNNASAFSRGVLFHGGMNGSGNLIRLPILPDKMKMGVVHATRSFTGDEVNKAQDLLLQKQKAGEVTAKRAEGIHHILQEFFASPDVLDAPDFNAQLTKVTYNTWPQFFSPAVGTNAIVPAMPKLVYLEIETLVNALLERYPLHNPASLLYRVLFDPVCVPLIQKYFNNLPGAFSEESEWGSYFFWGLDDKQHRVRLKREGNRICSFGGTISCDLTPEAISEALRTKKIYPGMFLCYLVVSLYYGMKCLGGFCQVNDLTLAKQAWMQFLEDLGEHEEAAAVIPVQTKELGGDGLVLVHLHTRKDELVPATGFDMLLDESDTTFPQFLELSKKVTLEEMMNPMLPEIYTVLYPSHERDPNLLSATPEKIYKATGLQEKLLSELPSSFDE